MSVTVSPGDIKQLWAEWDALLSQCASATIFMTPLWHYTWWQELGAGAELRLVTLREDGNLVGIAPLMCQQDVLTFLGDTDLWDYHEMVTVKDRDAELLPLLFDSVAAQSWNLMDLRSIRQDSPILRYFPDLAQARGYTTELAKEDVSPGLVLPATWEEYLTGLSKKDRHELRRKLRRLESQAAYNFYVINGTSAPEGYLEDFFTLMRDSRYDKAIFLTPERERFFRHMAQELARAGILKVFFMEVSGQRVASALCFDYGQTRFLYNSGYNPEYGALSVGLLLKALCLQQAIEEKKTYFDFLRGDEPYKYDLGAKDVQLYRLTIRR